MLDHIKAIDWTYLLTSTDGRIARMEYWIGTIAVGIVLAILNVLLGTVIGAILPPFVALGLNAIIIGVLTFALYPIIAKRANDRGRPVLFAQAALGAIAITSIILGLALIIGSALLISIAGILRALGGLAAIYILVDFGILKGVEGPNEHGPDPLARRIAA